MSLGSRIRQYRTARGLTLDEVVERMGHVVTKQALSKIERDRSVPRPTVLVAIARALEVTTSRLMVEPEYRFEMVAYRALAALPRREAERIESTVMLELERRLHLVDRLGLGYADPFAEKAIRVTSVAGAEDAAATLRADWDLGGGPISSVVDALETKGMHLVDVEAPPQFDGLAVYVTDEDGQRIACGAAARVETSRARQRMNHAHEVGHLAMEIPDSVDAEKAALRFAGAFLYPEPAVRAEFGDRRTRITQDELFVAKRRWGVSMQSVLYRLKDLGILAEAGYVWWCKRINQSGWRLSEPGDEAPERSTWTETYAHRAAAEGLICAETLAEYVPRAASRTVPEDIDRRALMKLPLAERNTLIQVQAKQLAHEYAATIDHAWLDADLGEWDADE